MTADKFARVDKTTRSWVRLFQKAWLRNPSIEDFKAEKFDDLPSDPNVVEQRTKVLKALMTKE